MNSDESDWDSMSEAPPVAANHQGVELRYPPPPQSNPTTGASQVVYPPQKQQQSKGPGPPQPQPRPKTLTPPNPKPRPPSSKPPPEAKAQSKSKRPKEVEKEPIKQKNILLTDKTSASLDNSFSDLNQERYEDSGLGSSPEKAHNALRGLENPSYEGQDEEEDEEEEGLGDEVASGQKYRLPVPDERIALLPFEDMRTHYLQVEYDDEGLLVDRILPTLVHCCSRASAELLGIVKLPLLLILVFLGQVLKMITSSLLRPASDHLLKPLLVSLHNLIFSPICSMLYNLSRMIAAILNPCCPTLVSPPWRYVNTSESNQLQI